MDRILAIIALGVLCVFPGSVSADRLKPHERLASALVSDDACCSTWQRPARVVRYSNYYTIRDVYPLPYRFGSPLVWEWPYRYFRR